MIYGQKVFADIPKKTIYLDLYVDESKNRSYTNYDGNIENITYIMILAVPKDKKDKLFQKLNNARCLSEKQNIFNNCSQNCRFFRSCLLRLIAMFKEYDTIIIDNIFHDKTTEMETHPYFNRNTIKQIRMQQLFEENKKIFFQTNEIEFLESDHRKGDNVNSQFIQLVDIILGTSLNVIHNTATNSAKKELSYKIKPLIERILSKDNIYAKMNSRYNYFNKQSISFFPKISKENLEENVKEYYSNEINFDNLLKNSNYFSNTKELLLKEETGQLSFFS